MLLLNHKLTCNEALNLGFISEIISKNEIPKILEKLENLSMLPPQSVIASKNLVRTFEQANLKMAHKLESAVLKERQVSEEAISAVMNFMSRKSKL